MRTALLTLTMCLLALPAHAKYSGGTGEPNDPYQIATAADLIALGGTPEDYDKHFILTADIDLDPNLPGRKVFDKAVIAPDIDDTGYEFDGTSFTGVFDGDGHTILHLTITGKGYLGLFGELDGCDVSKLGVADVNVMGSGDYVGGLAGSNGDLKTGLGRITDCWSTGTVSGHWEVGGLVGQNLAWVTHCHTSATVSGNTYVGALLGFSRGDVSQCYSAGAVSSTWDGGGLVGENVGLVAYCCSTAVVSGSWEVGGLVGRNYADVSQSYAAGMVSGSSSEVGGLIGYNYGDVSQCHSTAVTSGSWEVGGLVGENSGSVAHCYCTGMTSGSSEIGGLVARNDGEVVASFWDKQTSAQITSAGGTGKTTAEMQTRKTFLDAGWDFVGETTNGMENIWWIDEGKDYPRLSWERAVWFPDYMPLSASDHGIKTFVWTYGKTGEFTSQINGPVTIAYRNGISPLTGVRITNCFDTTEGGVTGFISNDGLSVKILGFEDRESREHWYFSSDASLTSHSPMWSFAGIYDGMMIDQRGCYLVKQDRSVSEKEESRITLCEIQDVKVLEGRYEKAVIMWDLSTDTAFTPLDWHGKDTELGVVLPTAINTGGYAVTSVWIFGRHRGFIVYADHDSDSGRLIRLAELARVQQVP